jgi:hypothetical protein
MVSILKAGNRWSAVTFLACLSACFSLWCIVDNHLYSFVVTTTSRAVYVPAHTDQNSRGYVQALACTKHVDYNSTAQMRYCLDMLRTSDYVGSSEFLRSDTDLPFLVRDWAAILRLCARLHAGCAGTDPANVRGTTSDHKMPVVC